MLFLVFQAGKDRFALRADRIVEVLPFVALKVLAHAPKGVAGVFNYRGTHVPAIDLSELTLGRPAIERLSTRIIVINCPPTPPQQRQLGLIAERATGLVRKDLSSFTVTNARIRGTPYLGPVFMDREGTIQLIQTDHLLADHDKERLFAGHPALPGAQTDHILI